MSRPSQPIVLLDEAKEDAKCVVINDDHKEEKAKTYRGRRGPLDRSEPRMKMNSKKAASAPIGEKELQELMRLADYEVGQDPNRGMKFLENSNIKRNNDDKVTDMVDTDDSNKTRSASPCSKGKKIDKIVSPWDVCQWGILSMSRNIEMKQQEHEQIDLDVMQIDDQKTGDSFLLDPGDAKNLVQNLTESCCPSILAWTNERLEEGKRKNQQSQKSRKQRNSMGKKRKRPSCGEDGNDVAASTKFPHLGIRPSDVNYRCPCDSNPFCLASMGGVMNDLLKERYQKGIAVSIIDEDENGESDSLQAKRSKFFNWGGNDSNGNGKTLKNHDAEIEVVDVDQNTEIVAEGKESEESNGVFAFMGGNGTALPRFRNKSRNMEEDVKIKMSTETSAIATCKRLGPEWSEPQEGEPAEVYSSKKEISNYPFNEEDYSKTTKDKIDQLRGSEHIDVSKVKKFISHIFDLFEGSKTTEMTMEEYFRTLSEWHKSLIFVNPTVLAQERDLSNSSITIALPPGIQNLGATCYLNTQLQCLAQIPVFLDGIFSWRPVNATHKMNGVMEKLQKLLAQMLVGGDSKYTSLDFSNALGIQHNEQQDPNEFARLLFDRMEESFQQCSINSSTDSVKDGDGLGKLLHRIFHGTTTYETICMKCGKTSVRSEGFMDLNLPIVHRKDEEAESDDKRNRKKGMIEKAFEKQKKKSAIDTDVQYCFDQYTKTETLSGDNQYFCEACSCKQDAQRVMSLTELPPVLNIQLSRYVFDRKKFIKKKLTDKVRLPTILTIDRHDSGTGETKSSLCISGSEESGSKKKYLLCAVMRHQGTSAYSGHYVAEAMDWTIGQWYEFNDESVKVLPMPSNSYVPHSYSDLDDETAQSAGSQDAYNMYYVDEDYLGENAITTMFRNKRLNSIRNGSSKIESGDTDVVGNLIREKIDRYSVLTELCYVDYAISERLRRRKDGIRKYMFVDPSSLLLQEGQAKEDSEPYFWVDGKMLRQFLACDRSLDKKLRSAEALVCPESLLCSHGSLHPRKARRGKLLRKSFYDSYVSLLVGERKFLSETSEEKESDVVGCVISSEERITCEECSKLYQNELSEKLEFLRNVHDLYLDILDETTDSTKSITTDPTKESIEEEYSFIVARSTITKFKKLVLDLMKSVSNFAKGGRLEKTSSQFDSEKNFVLDGIDDLDMSSFPGSSACTVCPNPKTTGKARMDDKIDEKFNSRITCSHGNCNDFSQRIVRYVPYKTWVKIKKVFPAAIEHKVLIYTVDGKMRKPNIEDDGCFYCRKEKDAIKNLTTDIERWAKETKENFTLKKLLDGKNISPEEITFHNFDSAQNNCRLVHRDDIANLCKSVRQLGRISKARIPEHCELKAYVENIAFPSYHSVVLDFERQHSARLLQSIRSLICCEHKRVIKSAIIAMSGMDAELQQRYQLSNNISVLSDEEYSSYINCLAELLVILNRDYQKQEDAEKDLEWKSTLFDDVEKFATSCHPSITTAVGEKPQCDEVLLFSLDGNSKEFSIVPGMCDHETCKKDFVPMIQKNTEVIAENVSVDSIDTGEQKRETGRKANFRVGSIAMSPIIVESDLEDSADTIDNTQRIRVFQYKADSELNDAMQSMKTIIGLPTSDNNDGLNGSLRRSTRKRKTKFPLGSITSEHNIDIGLHHNVAALRLLLYQNCQIPLSGKLTIATLSDDDSLPKSLEISFDWSSKTLNELVNSLQILKENVKTNPSEESFFFLYQVNKDDKCGDIETTLMDSLLQESNIESPESESNPTKVKKARKRSSERGFQGTLLQSSTTSDSVNELKSEDGNDSHCEVEINPKVIERKTRSNTIISDDEMNDTQVQNMEVEKGIPSDSSDEEVAIIPPPSPRLTLCNESGDDLQMKLVCKLMEVTNSKDESRCFEAVSWAVKFNPKYSEPEIIDAALAKFFEATSP